MKKTEQQLEAERWEMLTQAERDAETRAWEMLKGEEKAVMLPSPEAIFRKHRAA